MPTLWFSNKRMYLCAVTQFEHRKLAQSLHLATARSSALQLVHCMRRARISAASIAFMVTISRGNSETVLSMCVSWLPVKKQTKHGHEQSHCHIKYSSKHLLVY